MQFTPGMRVFSANGNAGTVVGNMIPSGEIIAIRLDNGRNISCLARLCKVAPFVIDPASPTDAEMAAAVTRGLADGSLVDAADWLAANRDLANPDHAFNDDGSDPGNCHVCHFFHR